MKPILFNTDMVRAILDGLKNVTRRVVKIPEGFEFIASDNNGYVSLEHNLCPQCYKQTKSPYQVGDILYVRESYCPNYFDYDTGYENKHGYKADFEAVRGEIPEPKWRPSIHMPKEAARIFLKVTGVRVERLQDITEEQAIKEGCSAGCEYYGNPKFEDVIEFEWTAVKSFVDVWNSTIPKHPNKFKRYPYYWDDNPWVWVIEFERCEKL